jgi:hypothetical protein
VTCGANNTGDMPEDVFNNMVSLGAPVGESWCVGISSITSAAEATTSGQGYWVLLTNVGEGSLTFLDGDGETMLVTMAASQSALCYEVTAAVSGGSEITPSTWSCSPLFNVA